MKLSGLMPEQAIGSVPLYVRLESYFGRTASLPEIGLQAIPLFGKFIVCPTQLSPGLLGHPKIMTLLCPGRLALTSAPRQTGLPTLQVNPLIRTKLLTNRAGTTEFDGTRNGLQTNECITNMTVSIGKIEVLALS